MSIDRKFFDEMPKIETHLHMDGAIRPQDIWAIAKKQGTTLPEIPEQTPEALQAYYRLSPDARFSNAAEFDRFLKMFGIVLSIMQTPEGLHDTANAHVRDLASQNYVYAETRFAPQYHRTKGLSLEDVISHTLRGLKKGEQDTGTMVRLIVCIGREIDPESAKEIAQAAMKFQDEGVVALDLACNEIDYPPEIHIPAFQLTFGSRLRRTVHAGELARSDDQRLHNIQTALTDLRADGLGHAIPLVNNPTMLADVIKRGVRIEACPLSNRITGASGEDLGELKLDELLRKGALVSLNTDDPLMFGNSLADVYREVADAYEFGPTQIRNLLRNAVLGAFCTPQEQLKIFATFEERGYPLPLSV